LTNGYSTKSYTYSFVDGHLDETRETELSENLTFATFESDLSMLFAIHEVSSYGEFANSGAISRCLSYQKSQILVYKYW
jgi:hypothetical protein